MNKRSRRACSFCKERKKRCDGKEPICGRCSERNLSTCSYSHHLDRRRPFSKTYVNSLTQQIKFYKTALGKARGQAELTGRGQEQDLDIRVNDDDDDDEAGDTPVTRAARLPSVDNAREVPAYFLDGRIDRFGRFHITSEGSQTFFGPRSIMSFLEHGSTVESKRGLQKRIQTPVMVSSLEQLFVELYFSFQNALFIFVWKSLFEREMELPSVQRNSDYFSNGLLNAILAVGSLFYHEAREPLVSRGDNYAAIAARHLQTELQSPTLTTVQIAGILAIFNVYKARDELASYYCGTAVTTCYTLGLNVENEMLRDSISVYETRKEARKIVFWATYFLDRALNSLLGRPTLLKSSSITCTVPNGSGLREFGKWKNPSSVSLTISSLESRFYREYSQISFTTELFILAEKPLEEIYLFFKPSDLSDIELTVAKATTGLIDFEASLPYFMRLKYILSEGSEACPGLFYFQIRLNYLHILLNRVFFIRNDSKDATFIDGTKDYQDRCYRSAVIISDLVSRFEVVFGLSRVDAFLPDMICSAAILLLDLIKRFDSMEGRREELGRKEKCISHYTNLRKCLIKCSENNLWAERAMGVIERLES